MAAAKNAADKEIIYGATEPRIFTPPLRELTPETSLGYDAIAFAKAMGKELYPWQEWLLIHALEIIGNLETGWHFRFRTVIILVSRQNGKTEVSKTLVEFVMLILGVPFVTGTAQSLDMAEEVWEGVVADIQANPSLAKRIEVIRRSNGKKELKLTNGSRYKVVSVSASSTDAARGKAADLVLLDELRTHKDWAAYGSISSTTMAKPNALMWCMSNAGDVSSVVLRHLRLNAHKALGDPDGEYKIYAESLGKAMDDDGEEIETYDDTVGLFEWSARPGCSIWSEEDWALSNPAMGYGRLTKRNLRAAANERPEAVFRTENLCQWVMAKVEPPFPHDAWQKGIDPKSHIAPDSPLAFGLDVSEDRSMSYIAVVGRRPDRNWHVEIIEARKGTGWIVDWFARRAIKPEYKNMTVALQANGAPVSGLVDLLKAVDGLNVHEVGGRDVAGYCGRFYDAVCACSDETESDATPVYHRKGAAKDVAAMSGQLKPLGDALAWDRKKSMVDVSPMMAASMAFGLATSNEVLKPVKSAYEDYDVVFI